jgi:hypothetical protein
MDGHQGTLAGPVHGHEISRWVADRGAAGLRRDLDSAVAGADGVVVVEIRALAVAKRRRT